MKSQRELRSEIEKAETKKIEERLNSLHEKAKINPNTLWEARKRSKGCNTLEYNTFIEEGTPISDPHETKEHIANYFDQLYQVVQQPKWGPGNVWKYKVLLLILNL